MSYKPFSNEDPLKNFIDGLHKMAKDLNRNIKLVKAINVSIMTSYEVLNEEIRIL